jgi:hypothetical protein
MKLINAPLGLIAIFILHDAPQAHGGLLIFHRPPVLGAGYLVDRGLSRQRIILLLSPNFG